MEGTQPEAFFGFVTASQTHYFGFSFTLENMSASGAPAGTMVYGWGQVHLNAPQNGTLVDWAYEDNGGPIQVGDTVGQLIPEAHALALFALGAAGVVASRKRKKQAE